MKKIVYEFCDGTMNEVEVSDELYAVYEEMVKAEIRNHRRNTRRHISLNYLNEFEIDIAASDDDLAEKVIRDEDEAKIHNAIALLSFKQRLLVEKIFFKNMSLREIAKETGVSHQALSQQMMTIYKKLKKLF